MNDQENEDGFSGIIEKVPEDKVVVGYPSVEKTVSSKLLESSEPLYSIWTCSASSLLDPQLDATNGIVFGFDLVHYLVYLSDSKMILKKSIPIIHMVCTY